MKNRLLNTCGLTGRSQVRFSAVGILATNRLKPMSTYLRNFTHAAENSISVQMIGAERQLSVSYAMYRLRFQWIAENR